TAWGKASLTAPDSVSDLVSSTASSGCHTPAEVCISHTTTAEWCGGGSGGAKNGGGGGGEGGGGEWGQGGPRGGNLSRKWCGPATPERSLASATCKQSVVPPVSAAANPR